MTETIPVKADMLTPGKKARGLNGKAAFYDKTNPPDRIIIHWTGPYPGQTPAVVRNWWENGPDGGGVQASAHFIIKDGEIVQCLPTNEVGWHSGDGRNHKAIGVEVIPMNVAGEFSEASIRTLKWLVANLRSNLLTNFKLERHFDGAQKKDCPRFYTPAVAGGQERWEKLKAFLDG